MISLSKSLLIIAFIVSAIFSLAAYAQIIDENAMFADTQTIVENSKPVETKAKPYSLGLSGEVSSISTLGLGREYLLHGDNDNSHSNIALGNLLVDGRYHNSYKLFANIETQHTWENNQSDLYLREAFADTPIANKVYLRWGRQVLQWGRCYLWNPTDLINVDKKTFISRIGSRNGVYGVKLHIPWGTKYNFYSFLDTGSELDSQAMGGAIKFEWLLGGTEMAVSYWNKKDYLPVYGYDFSSKMFNVDINGEVSVSKGFTRNMLRQTGNILSMDKRTDEWITRASLDLGKSFDFNNQKEKINITGEFFYNGAGYQGNVFNDSRVYAYAAPLTVGGVNIGAGDKKTFFLGHDLFEANYYGRYYAALFTTVNNFFTSDYTLSANYIENINDQSSVMSLGAKYQNLRDWYVDLTAYAFMGSKHCEYTFLNQAFSLQMTLGWKF